MQNMQKSGSGAFFGRAVPCGKLLRAPLALGTPASGSLSSVHGQSMSAGTPVQITTAGEVTRSATLVDDHYRASAARVSSFPRKLPTPRIPLQPAATTVPREGAFRPERGSMWPKMSFARALGKPVRNVGHTRSSCRFISKVKPVALTERGIVNAGGQPYLSFRW